MKKVFLFLVVSLLACTALFSVGDASAQRREMASSMTTSAADDIDPELVSPNLVISQFQTGGASPNDEFIEIHNSGSTAVDLNGYSIVYSSLMGTLNLGPMAAWSTTTVLQPGQYYLIASQSYDGSTAPNQIWTVTISFSGMGGGLALKNPSGTIIDQVGWGSATAGYFETVRAAAPPANSGGARLNNGCQDTDHNANDFAILSPSSPRNASSSPFPCGGGGTTLFAAMTADPTTTVPSGNVLFTVTVIPATTPPSTAIQVFGNLSQIGGSSLQQFYDDGTHGDVTPADNVFTFDALVPANMTGGTKNITAVASDAEMRSANTSVNVTVTIPGEAENPLLFGNPSGATTNINNPENYLITRPQLSLSYKNSYETANWVAWRLDSSWIGSSGRVGDFEPDPLLPSMWYHVTNGDYSGSGYDRGHLCPSGDRTRSANDNQATFYMTNIIPQIADNNQGPWLRLEEELRVIAGQGKEIYIFAGGQGTVDNGMGGIKTIGNGVVVPKWTWKVVLIIPNGSNDLTRLGKNTRVFGVIMSNESIVRSTPWRNYRVTVDQVETLTGFDFFSNVNTRLQTRLESVPDTQ